MSSLDKNITTNLIQTLEDGRKGYAEAASKLADSDWANLTPMFNAFSTQRAKFSAELESLAAAYGDDIDESGSVLATAHRGWMSIKDLFAGSSPDGVLDAVEQGETYALEQFSDALRQDVSPRLRIVIERQFSEIQKALAEVTAIRVSA